jgi:hypothetical protein
MNPNDYYKSSYLVLFNQMPDIENRDILLWLRKLSSEGRIVSVDELIEMVNSTALNDSDPYRGFAVIQARDNDEINAVLSTCPGLNQQLLTIYKLK